MLPAVPPNSRRISRREEADVEDVQLVGEQVVPEAVREHHDGVVRDRAGNQDFFHVFGFFTKSLERYKARSPMRARRAHRGKRAAAPRRPPRCRRDQSRRGARVEIFASASSTRRSDRLVASSVSVSSIAGILLRRSAPRFRSRACSTIHLAAADRRACRPRSMRISSGARGSGTVQPAKRQAASSAGRSVWRHDAAISVRTAIELRARAQPQRDQAEQQPHRAAPARRRLVLLQERRQRRIRRPPGASLRRPPRRIEQAELRRGIERQLLGALLHQRRYAVEHVCRTCRSAPCLSARRAGRAARGTRCRRPGSA